MYIKLSTLEYPRYEGDIRIEYPNLPDGTGDEFPVPDEYARIEFPELPQLQKYQYVEKGGAIQTDGQWYATYIVKELTEAEVKRLSTSKPLRPRLDASGSAPNVIE